MEIWLAEENCTQKNFSLMNIFTRWIISPNESYQIIEFTGKKDKISLFSPHEFCIQRLNFMVAVNFTGH